MIDNRLLQLMWIAIEKGGMTFVSLVTFFIYAKVLQPEQFGYAVFALAIGQGVAMIFAPLFEDALIHESCPSQSHYDTAFWAGTVLSILLCILVRCLIAIADMPAELEFLVELSLSIILFVGLSSTYVASARINGDFDILAKRSFLARLIGALVGVTLALNGLGPVAVIAQAVLIEVISFLYLFVLKPRKIGFKVDSIKLKKLTSIGWLLCLRRLSWDGTARGIPLILGALAGPHAVGAYGFAWRTVEMPRSAISSGLLSYALPVFSRNKAHSQELHRLFASMTHYTSLICAPLFVGLAVTAPTFVPVLFGDKWDSAIVPIQVMSLLALISSSRLYVPSIFTAVGKPNISLMSDIIGTASATTFTFLFASELGIYAAMIGLVMRSVIVFPFSVRGFKTVLGCDIRTQLSPLFRPWLATFIMAIVVQLISIQLTGFSIGVSLIAQIVTGFTIYTLMIFLFMPDIKTSLRQLING